MNEIEEKAFRNFIQAKTGLWHEEISELGSNEEGDFLAEHIMSEYMIQRKGEYPNFFMVLEGHSMSFCEGCFNQFGWCGTPCTTCEKNKEFDRDYKPFLRCEHFTVYRRVILI